MDNPNKPSTADIAYASTKALLGAIPLAGSAATELFGLLVTPPLEKRRQKWMDQVAEKLKALEEAGKIDLSRLSENDQFIDTVLHATVSALKASDIEKIQALQNAIINTAIDDAPEKAKSQVFLNFIDSFTVWHIKIIDFFNNPTQWFVNANQRPPNIAAGSMFSALVTAFPSLQNEGDFVDVIWNDLRDAGLHRSSDLKTMMTGSGIMVERTTPLGKEFIAFISSHR